MKDWLIHYGDSGEADTSFFETEAKDELGALFNFADDSNVPVPVGRHSVDSVKHILNQHGFIMGDIEEN